MSDKSESKADQVKHLRKLIEKIEYCMMTTATPDGVLRSRPMANQELDANNDVWFFTKENSGKADELRNDSHINLSYSDPKGSRFVSVSGRGTIVRDAAKAKELWSPVLKAWFPDGLEDPDLVLLKVRIEQAEYWDSATSKMVELFGFVKALVTGTEFEPGETAKVDLRKG